MGVACVFEDRRVETPRCRRVAACLRGRVGLLGGVRCAFGIPGDLLERRVNVQASFARDANHLIGSRRRATDSQDGIALLEEADRDWVEDLLEHVITDAPRSGGVKEGERQPLPEHRHVARAKDGEGERLHAFDVLFEQRRVVAGAGAVGSGDQNPL